MKTKLVTLVAAMCGIVTTTSVLGQTSYFWTNQNPALLTAGDLNQGTNWTINGAIGAGGADPNGVPRPDFWDGVSVWGDEMLFDGRTTGAVVATQNGGSQANGGGSGQSYGLRIHLSSNQTNSVTIQSPVSVSGGMRMNYFLVDAGSGGLNLGDHSGNCLDVVGGVLNGQILGFTNNSTVPAVVTESLRWRMGGAGAHPFIFAGSGDWVVENHLRSANSSSVLVQKYGPGTMTWIGTNNANANFSDQLGTPITIAEGTMVWKTSDLVGGNAGGSSAGNPNIVNNATLWKYDANDGGTCVILGNISGTGPLQVNAGTLNLSGSSTFGGALNLTGGELIAGSTENAGVSGPLGQGGVISFHGGSLGWSAGNAFDYSSRFDTTAGQAYSLDTAGASPVLATGLTSIGASLTKLGGGTLTLAGANTYSGLTTVAAGELLFQGTKTGVGDIMVADSAALGIVENGSTVTPGTLTLGTVNGAISEFNNVTNHATATLVPNNLVSAGPVTVNVNSGRFFSIGETFPLLKWTSGAAPASTLGFLAGAGGHLNTNGSELDLVIDDPPYIWTAAGDSTWNTTSIDWTRSGSAVAWANGHFALFDDTAASGNVTLSGTISPTNTTINNNTLNYAITSSPGNVIGGGGSLIKNGAGTLTLPGGANTYTGATTIGGGVVAVGVLTDGGLASDIGAANNGATNIVISGGTLEYTGAGASVNRLFSVGPGGGTIDNEGAAALVFNNSGSLGMSGNGPRTLTLTGSDTFGDTIASAIVNHPAGTHLTKNGAGTWILTGTNTYAGGTTLLGGTLQVGAGGAGGTLGSGDISTSTGTGIDFQRTGTLTVPGDISGNCGVTNDGSGTVILANNNGYTGGTTINAGTLQVGNGGASGSLFANGPILDDSLLVFNTAGTYTYQTGGAITGTGNLIVQGGGFIKAIGANAYTGWTSIAANTTFQPVEGQDGAIVSTSAITNNGTLRLVRQDATIFYQGPIVGTGKVQIGANNVNVGTITLLGTNTYSGGTFIGDNTLILGDNSTPGAGAIAGNVQFVNNFTISQDNVRTLEFLRPDNFTFGGTITTNFASPQANQGVVDHEGTGTLVLTGNNTYGSGTIISAGPLQVGNGGATGTIGSGPVTDNFQLILDRSGTLTIPGVISGAGSVAQLGSGTTILGSSNTYLGATTVSNGTLVVKAVGGDMNVWNGTTLIPWAMGSVGTLYIGGNFTMDSATIVATINESLAQSNSVISAASTTINNSTLKVLNYGPTPAVGDKFFIFPAAVTGITTVLSPGITLANNLSLDGSVMVTAVESQPLKITSTVSGGNLNLSWPASFTGLHLQVQTNTLAAGLKANWTTVPGSETGNTYAAPIGKASGVVFYRLVP
jgi:fibronectin-binding autotransporter adhesin